MTIVIDHVLFCGGDMAVTVTEQADGTATLWWADGVANEWLETHASTSLALARLAALVRCGESDWELGFTHGTERDFEFAANRFFGEACD